MKFSKSIQSLVETYKQSRSKSAQSVLIQASACFDARNKLTTKADYNSFCQQINEKPNSSYLKKLHCIANKKSRFEQYIDLIPPCSSALYLLSQIDDLQFQHLIDEKKINAALKLHEIRALNSKPKSPVIPTPSIKVTLTFSDFSKLAEFNAELDNLKLKYASQLLVDAAPLQAAISKHVPPSSVLHVDSFDTANDSASLLAA